MMTDEKAPKTLTLEQVLEARKKARTPEQLELQRKTDERNVIIQAGVKQPASGTFGKAAK